MGGYRFSRGRTNRKRHETHESCSSIRPLALKIFTLTSVSFPTVIQPPRRHSTTTIRSNPIRRGMRSRLVATEVSRFFLYIYFEQFRHHPELPIRMRLVHALRILLDRISTGIFHMVRSALRGTSHPLLLNFPIRRGLYRKLCEIDVAGGKICSHHHRTLEQGRGLEGI